MTKYSKKLDGYLKGLLVLGIIILSGGIVVAFSMLSNTNPSDWSPYYFYFDALGAILGYWYISRGNPGGRVTINFDKSTFSEDEKALDNLIIKYRSNFLMLLTLIIYVFADFVITNNRAQSHPGTIEGYVVSIIISSAITLTLTMGVKYLSAWWNIKRNWKKEFKTK